MGRKLPPPAPVFQRIAEVEVNGMFYNFVCYCPEAGAVILMRKKHGKVEHTLDTTLYELSTQYGLRTAVRVRTRLLTAGYGGLV